MGGSLTTHGDQVTTYVVEGGSVGELRVGGHILTTGKKSSVIEVKADERTPLTNYKSAGRSWQGSAQYGRHQTGFVQE